MKALFFRAILPVNVLALAYQLTRLQPDLNGEIWRAAVLAILTLAAALLLLVSFVRPRALTNFLSPLMQRITGNRLAVYGVLLLIFAALTILAAIVLPVSDNNGEPLRILSCIDSLFWLFTVYRWYLPPLTWDNPPAPKNRDRWIAAGIFALCLGMSAWQMLDTGPMVYDDSSFYYATSQQIMGQSLGKDGDFPGWQWFSPFTFSFAEIMALTRMVADTPVSLVIVQHLIRALTAVLTFWLLRQTYRPLAIVCGVLVALAAPTLVMAQTVLSDSFYVSTLHLFTLLMLVAFRRGKDTSLGVLIATGVFCALTAWMRPVGLLLVLCPASLMVLYRWWKPLIVMLIGLAIAVLAISGLRWTLDRQFSLMPSQSDVYFYVPLFYYRPLLYDTANGVLSQKMADVCLAPDSPVTAYGCSDYYRLKMNEPFSLTSVYIEAIRAKPLYFASIVTGGVKLFVGDNHSRWIPYYEPAKYFPRVRNEIRTAPPYTCIDGRCAYLVGLVSEWLRPEIANGYYEYAYVRTYKTGLTDENRPLRVYNRLFFYLMQPQLLTGQFSSAFWGWLVLVAALIAETYRSRNLFQFIVLNVLIILYHALVTVGANIITYRYVYVVTPHFIFLAGLLYVMIYRAAREVRQTKPAQPVSTV